MKHYIGCSGYYYPSWKKHFYPEGTAAKNWLAYYSTVFNTVELNGTFYRTPTIEQLKKYAEVTPVDFRFSVKMSRHITHVQRLSDKQFIIDFQKLIREGLGNKLIHFLFQMPPSFHYSIKNLDMVISSVSHSPQNVVEFRHASWWNDHTQKIFSDYGITFCNVDYPGLKTYFIHTSPFFYLRMHGNPLLFASEYSFTELEKIYHHFPDAKQYAVYFNNTMYDGAYKNALQFMQLIGEKNGENIST